MELDLNKISETKCFCESGLDEEAAAYTNGWKRLGHHNRYDRPVKLWPSHSVSDPS